MADLVKDSVTAEHLLVDVMNEPDNYGIRWEAAAGKPGVLSTRPPSPRVGTLLMLISLHCNAH